MNAADAVRRRENKKIDVKLSSTEENIFITIRDNGKGIKNENIKDVFKPFFSTRKGGTGLGLSISLEIIEKHNGTLTVESEYEKWTEFQILLPIRNRS